MVIAKINVTGTCAKAEIFHPVTAGMAGVDVAFAFDETWDGLGKSVILVAGRRREEAELVGDAYTIKGTVLVREDQFLRVGVCGYGSDGAVVIPTVWAGLGMIRPGAYPRGSSPDESEHLLWAQVMGRIGMLEQGLVDDTSALRLLIDTDMLPAVHDADGRILTDENRNIVLRY